ncbi:hypothetical protein Micbo1qcDRAFT_163355 [Microdochium bolleyi]|uniref:Uncharacterized protein n=1 Tax=Microdochium bolleyi TaxID=196109 RepID=A0A136J2V7_9PEZI|nr:hypothetical protein Micbo1qcDRAFT_163355 [Microdochium bolleyi]
MAAQPPRHGTSTDDEWQEIDTDAFSILSLSTDVEDDEDIEGDTQYTRKDRPSPQPQDGFETRDLEGRPSSPGTSATALPLYLGQFDTVTQGPNDIMSFDDAQTAVTHNSLRGASLLASHDHRAATDFDPTGSDSEHIEDDRIAPSFLHNSITSSIKLIDGILELSSAGFRLGNLEQLPNLTAQCVKLKSQLASLAPIAKGYTMHWLPERSNGGRSLPLDPGLHDWLSRLREALLAAEQRLIEALGDRDSAEADMDADEDVERHTEMLTDLWAQMDEFLPIIEADFDEFHTAAMTFQSLVDSDDTQRTSRTHPPSDPPCFTTLPTTRRHETTHRQSRPGPNDVIFQLRRELYALKDQIVATTEELAQFQTSRTSPPTAGTATADVSHASSPIAVSVTDITTSFSTLKAALERILSNNPSDWLDYSITGGLTYIEFARIRPDTVAALRAELQKVTGDVFLERCQMERLARQQEAATPPAYESFDRSAQEEYCDEQMKWAMMVALLHSLQVIHDVLASMFVRDRGGDDQ